MAGMEPHKATTYDDVPYTSLPLPQTHPDRLSIIGTLLGVSPPGIEKCRVLELGCAGGGNLIPMALQLPEAHFTGIDLSRRQVEAGLEAIEDLGLTNITLRHLSITDVGPEFGEFDYIIAHGVFSWVPAEVQEALLRICRSHLAPNGIAYISYNVYPGWHMRGMIRDMMRYHTQRFDDPKVKVAQARALLNFLAKALPNQQNSHSMMLQSESQMLSKLPDYYLLHEHLEDINEPLYFYQFIERTRKHRLQYLAEASFAAMADSVMPPNVVQTLSQVAFDVVSYEQYLDFVRNRTFRQTLLIHEETPINRKIDWRHITRYGISASSNMRPISKSPDIKTSKVEQFQGTTLATITTGLPLAKAALCIISSQAPLPLPFDRLMAQANRQSGGKSPVSESEEQQLATTLLQAYSIGLLELTQLPAGFALESTRQRPLALKLARVQARSSATVTNALHQPLSLTEPQKALLLLLDGEHDLKALLAAMRPYYDAGKIPRKEGVDTPSSPAMVKHDLQAFVDTTLAHFGRKALLAPL